MSANEPVKTYNLSDIKPSWSTLPDGLSLGNGFTSGSLIRSLMAIGTCDTMWKMVTSTEITIRDGACIRF